MADDILIQDEDPSEDKKEESKKEETSSENVTSESKKYNAELKEEYSTPKTDFTKFSFTFSLPSVDLTTLNTKLNYFNNLNLDTNSKELKDWRKVVEESVEYYTPAGLYQNRFSDENSHFEQGVETKTGELKSISSLKFKKTDGELKGEMAILKVSKLLGLGDVVSIPLPHSGIWVTVKPPTEKDLIDFYNSIFREKIVLGRATSGLTLTNFSVYINNRLFDFIMKHVHSINYGDIPKDELRNYILIHDFPILAWGFASSIYPNGFDYQRACVNDVEQCTYIAKAIINLTKLLWVDNRALTDYQKDILSENRPNKFSIENYRKYIVEHTRTKESTISLANGLKIKLRIPTMGEFIADGMRWVNGINAKIDNLIVDSGDEEEAKSQMLEQYVRSSLLRQFSHFVEYIETDENAITDRDTINEVLEVFSADDDIRSEFSKAVLNFKADTTIALIGIPEYKCPNCGKEQNTNPINERFTNVIPLDTLALFFSLITLRISKILEREM